MFNITGDVELHARLEALQTRVPRIMARTLTGLAFDARQEVQSRLSSWVTLRRPFLRNSVAYQAATETTQTATVGFDERANFAVLLEDGGTRTPAKSSSLAVPTGDLKRTSSGGISAGNRPRNVLGKKGVFLGAPEGHKKKTFGIWKQSKRDGLQLLYVFKRSTKYRKKMMRFRETVQEVVDRKAPERFASAIEKAAKGTQ